MKILIGIQARSGGARLPGKIYEMIGERSVLEWCYLNSKMAAETATKLWGECKPIVIGTVQDEKLGEFCANHGLEYSSLHCEEDDLVARYSLAATEQHADVIVRITADCPFIHKQVIVEAIDILLKTETQYCSNTIMRSYPEDQDVQVCLLPFLQYYDKYEDNREHPFFAFDHCYHRRDEMKKDGFTYKQMINGGWGKMVHIDKFSIDTKETLEAARNWYEGNRGMGRTC